MLGKSNYVSCVRKKKKKANMLEYRLFVFITIIVISLKNSMSVWL